MKTYRAILLVAALALVALPGCFDTNVEAGSGGAVDNSQPVVAAPEGG